MLTPREKNLPEKISSGEDRTHDAADTPRWCKILFETSSNSKTSTAISQAGVLDLSWTFSWQSCQRPSAV